MSIRKVFLLAGLALALAALIPAPALAKSSVTRHVKGHTAGTGCTNVLTGEFSANSTGIGSHIGTFTRPAEGIGGFTDATLEHYEGIGSFTVIAANGDELFGEFDFHATGDPLAIDHGDVIEADFIGGTGRFADVSGWVREVLTVHTTSFEEPFSCAIEIGRFSGEITY